MWKQLLSGTVHVDRISRRYWRHILAAFLVIIMGFIFARRL